MDREVVLVVEDSEPAFLEVQRAAETLGYAVEWALNGAEALRLVRLHPYRAIVLDLYLPLLDGLSFLRILRETGAVADVPVVMVSAAARQEDVRRATALGAAAFVEKPIEAEPFTAVLAAALAGEARVATNGR